MENDIEIKSADGKVYKSLRAFHIAMGIAVRKALIEFYKEVKQYAISEMQNFYEMEFHGSEYYENTYGMIKALEESNDLDGAISYFLKGNWEKKITFEIEIDWSFLNSYENGGFGTYTSFNKEPVVEYWDELLESGLPIGIYEETGRRHSSFSLSQKIQDYIDKHIDEVVDRALKKF